MISEQKNMKNNKLTKIFNKQVLLCNGSWNTTQIREILSKMNEWKVQNLNTSGNFNEKILKEIGQIAFPNLKILNAGFNDLTSIQSLRYLQSPQLYNLQLNGNLLLTVKSLRKCRWTELKQLNLGDNKITHGQQLFQGAFLLSKLWIDNNFPSKYQMPSFQFICKLETGKLTTLSKKQIYFDITREKIKRQGKLQGIIKKKWELVKLYFF